MSRFERRLFALGFPEAAAFDGSSERQVLSLASWLEDRVTRQLPIEARGPLRAGGPGALQAYLEELEAPENVMADVQAQRFQGGWCKRWPFGDVRGRRAVPCGTGPHRSFHSIARRMLPVSCGSVQGAERRRRCNVPALSRGQVPAESGEHIVH